MKKFILGIVAGFAVVIVGSMILVSALEPDRIQDPCERYEAISDLVPPYDKYTLDEWRTASDEALDGCIRQKLSS